MVILVDSSIWADFFRGREPRLEPLFAGGMIVHHPFVTGEIAMGSFPSAAARDKTIRTLSSFPAVPVCGEAEFYAFVAGHALGGSGIGFIDAHLLASAGSQSGVRLWTRDKRLAVQAERLSLAWES